MVIRKSSAYDLINAVLSRKPFEHPNPKVLKGTYEFVRYNLDGSISLENIKTKERIYVGEIIFHSMQTIVPEGYLEKVIHGASDLGLIHVLDREQNDIFLRQVDPDEIETKYQLVKGRDELYELSQPKYTRVGLVVDSAQLCKDSPSPLPSNYWKK